MEVQKMTDLNSPYGVELDINEIDDTRKRKREGSENDYSGNLSLSCNMCKQRKVKCDRVHPSCGWCTRNSVLCVYTEKRKPGLKTGFGKELIERLEKLETVISQNIQSVQDLRYEWMKERKNSQPKRQQSLQEDLNQNYSSMASSSSSGNHIRRRESIGSICSTVGSAQLPDLPSKEVILQLIHLYFEHINVWCPILDPHQKIESFFSEIGEPEPHLVTYAIVAVTMRFLPERAMPESEKQHYHTIAAQKITLLSLEIPTIESLEAMSILAVDTVGYSNGPKCWAILSMICSIAMKLGLNREGTAKDVISSRDYESSPISTTGVSIIPEAEDVINEDRRRRLFWCAYLLDRFSSTASSFVFNIPSSEIFRRLPTFGQTAPDLEPLHFSNDNIFSYGVRARRISVDADDDSLLEPFAYQIELLGILSSIHEFLRKPININSQYDVEKWHLDCRKFCLILDEWKIGLPDKFSTIDSVISRFHESEKLNPMWFLIHSLYNTVVIKINSSVAYPYQQSKYLVVSASARELCLQAVANIVSITKVVNNYPETLLKTLGPHFAFTLWVAARLSIVHSFTTRSMLADGIPILVRTLSLIGNYWTVARRYSDLLLYVIDEGWLSKLNLDNYNNNDQGTSNSLASSSENHDNAEDNAQMESAKILSDMRRTASDLDFLLSMSHKKHHRKQRRSRQKEVSHGDVEHSVGESMGNQSIDSIVTDSSSGDPFDLKDFSPSHQFDIASIFEWFNWPKISSTASNGRPNEGGALTPSFFGDLASWGFAGDSINGSPHTAQQ
ncbi:fungal-specific transcription factor domain-containing protein [Dipodascopsis uninucleata]